MLTVWSVQNGVIFPWRWFRAFTVAASRGIDSRSWLSPLYMLPTYSPCTPLCTGVFARLCAIRRRELDCKILGYHFLNTVQ